MNEPSKRKPKVLVADDQSDIVAALRLLLKQSGYECIPAATPAEVLQQAEVQDLDLCLVDMNYARDTTSGGEGLELVSKLSQIAPEVPVLVMTAWSSVGSAVEAMKRGARDYIEKPWQNERLLAAIKLHVELCQAARNAGRLQAQGEREQKRDLPQLIAESPRMREVTSLLERVAGADVNVLITGEHGTGKDVVARWLHAASPRARRAFVPVNAGALADGVFESELFGHVKGAFTDAKADRLGCFELADEGTLFLDEIGTMPAAQQAKLLRVLQSGEFQPVGSSRTRRCDVRVLSATNVNIAREVAQGNFREDLLYRLNTVEIQLPPLRERSEDIPALAGQFLATKAARYGKALRGFTSEALAALLSHAWPGNVRELEHVVERAVVLAGGEEIQVPDLTLRPSTEAVRPIERMTLAEAEAYLIRTAISRTNSANEAANQLGLSRSAFYRRLQALGLKVSE
ncbi:MAG: sigma-54-dependent transcriptional regulator [Polyangiaceae bacterium]